jgi:hypothetical protein
MQDKLKTIKNELAGLINSHSLENGSNTPDFILAAYLLNCLTVFDHANNWNTAWHSKDGVPADWRENGPPTAVRAHDAGTDKGLRKARVEDAFDKIACANTVTICSLDEMESIVNRALDGEFDADLRVPPDSHAAESAAQLDAEDPAEPGEDVPSGYMKLGAVENAIRAAWARAWFGGVTPESFEQFLALIMARLAPKPSLAEEMEPQLELKLENVKPHASRTRDRILALLREKEWLAGYEITDQLCIRYGMVISDTNATARLREARRTEFGGHNIVSRPRAGSSAWEYACHD